MGNCLTRLEIWVCEKPCSLNKERTGSGLSGVSKWTTLEADRANYGDNPHEFMRVETHLRDENIDGFSRLVVVLTTTLKFL